MIDLPVLDDEARLDRINASRVAGIKPHVLSVWKYRKLIATDTAGRYRIGDVLELERRTRRTVLQRGGHSRILTG